MVRKLLRAARPDYVQYDCKGHPGYLGYPRSKVGPSAPGIVKDSLAVYRKVTAAMGVALLVHYSGVFDQHACAEHPEWAARSADNKPDPASISLFGPYLRERMLPHLLEIIDRHDVDGFWVDGDCWSVKADHHPDALRRFAEKVGPGIAPPTKPGEPHWIAWGDVHRARFLEYVQEYLDAVRAHRPGVRVTSNYLYTPHAPIPETVPIDFCSGDLAPNASVDAARLNGRYLTGVDRPWDLMSWAFTRSKGQHPWGVVYKPPQQLCQEAANVIALGGGVQLFLVPDRNGGIPHWLMRSVKQVADFVHARRNCCGIGRAVPQVALLLDRDSHFNRCSRMYAPWSGELASLEGTLHALLDAGHDVSIRATHQLRDVTPDQWPLVVVPEYADMPKPFVDELKRYVREGGKLIVLGADAASLFLDELGVEVDGDAAVMDAVIHPAKPFSGAVTQVSRARISGSWLPVRIKTGRRGVKVIATRTTTQCREGSPERIAGTLARCGKGRIAAIYGPAGTSHMRTHTPMLSEFLGKLADVMYRPLVALQVAPHARVNLHVREDGERAVVHLVNQTGSATASNADTERYHFYPAVPPTGEIRLTLQMSRRPRAARLEPAGK
ncbi:MAG TPA: hypothetical protein PKB10_08565, partial [Tepidisphaeraceae bacterium]|nr:hypothetical protein [Tepidisphaeraceae bacterium]